ncbi:hypothetical protein G7092_09440 [Mucilaginibacter sp. HC2]|uniref:hypothetical protein n=1 Tax=Mucilaginibacter inviolabilis TaxID=2714892 RepID=UPI001407CDF0|nr:hypothetical protein [Mucilaginibacter inviolabilis]NHA04019.1 hypothetical protein [Mucilaginibacter inviolabilis]
MRASILLLLILCAGKLAAQTAEQFKPALMETKYGAKIVYTSAGHSLTLDVVSAHIKPLDKSGVIEVDKKVLQYILIENSALSLTDTTVARQKAELLGYAQYELDYIKNEVKLEIADLQQSWVNINNKIYLLWYYRVPQNNKQVPEPGSKRAVQQVNLSTLCFAHVLNLNSPVLEGEDFNDTKELLTKIAKTLKQNNSKIDLGALYNELHQ